MNISQTDNAASGYPPRWKQRIKSVLFFCFYYSGLERLVARLIRADAAAVLMYHGVCDAALMPPEIDFHLTREIFERQMRVLARRYRVVPLADLVASLARGERIEKSVALTFDDGYRNNAVYAAPVLNGLGLPYTVFVATSYVESGAWMPLNQIYWLWSAGELKEEEMSLLRRQVRARPLAETAPRIDELWKRRRTAATTGGEASFAMLSWDEIREMANSRAEFGSHTHSHCNMAAENEFQRASELVRSRQLLEKHLARPVRLFAYPYGRGEHMSEAARRSVVAAGYECAVSGEYGLVTAATDRFCLPRLGCDRRIWLFAGEITYQFAKHAFRKARSRAVERTPAEQARASHG